MERRLHPEGRRCVDCGGVLSRQAKFRCFNCHVEHMKRKTENKNSNWKEEGCSSVAANKVIVNRFGPAKGCSNVNCRNRSRNYRWTRLKSRSGRRGGIWISLCISCLKILDHTDVRDKKTDNILEPNNEQSKAID